mgnify:CR=1 FL=1
MNNKIKDVKDKARSLAKTLPSADLDIETQIDALVFAELKDINGDVNGGDPEKSNPKDGELLPLVDIKASIIGDLNTLVTLFNENNKAIKDAEKKGTLTPEMLKELKDNLEPIIAKGKHIRAHLEEGKDKAKILDERLDNLLDETIPDLEVAIKDKYKMIEETDEIYDMLQGKIEKAIADADQDLQDINAVIEELEGSLPKGTKDKNHE